MELCIAMGWVIPAAPSPRGFTKLGTPRKYRVGRLTATEYSHERRLRFRAMNLTKRGTVPKFPK